MHTEAPAILKELISVLFSGMLQWKQELALVSLGTMVTKKEKEEAVIPVDCRCRVASCCRKLHSAQFLHRL